jgi:hypothetical protein
VEVTTYDAVTQTTDYAEGPGDPLRDCTEFPTQVFEEDIEEYGPNITLEELQTKFVESKAWPKGPGSYIEFTAEPRNNVQFPFDYPSLTCEQGTVTIDLVFALQSGQVTVSFSADLVPNANPDHVSGERGLLFAMVSASTIDCNNPSFFPSLEKKLDQVYATCNATRDNPGGRVTAGRCCAHQESNTDRACVPRARERTLPGLPALSL